MDHISSELKKLHIDRSQRGESRRRGGKGIWLITLLVIAAIAAAAYGIMARDTATVVRTVRPRLESSEDSAVLVATGYVVAHHKIQVGSKIAGRVAWIGVDKGDRVSRDQTLVRLEDREFRAQYDQAIAALGAAQARLEELERGSRPEEIARTRADVERAEAQLRTDEANFKRTESLVREGVIPSQNLDDARGRFETSRAALDSTRRTYELTQKGPRVEQIDNARSEVERARAAADYAKTILDATEIRAPVSGTILERNVEQGEMVTTSFVGDRGAKSFVVTLADLNDIQVELDINQNDFNRVAANQPCTVVTDAYPDRQYDCRVDEIAPEANRQKATVQVKVKILKPDNYVKPEMNARVTFLSTAPERPREGEAAEEMLYLIPRAALVERESGKVVFVVSDGMVQVKPVEVEREVGSDVYVSRGLTGSESIIIGEDLKDLKAGDRVELGQ
jgi:RND family efflux transporter MFP subunit